MIDTEHGSGDLYADLLPEGYDVLRLAPPFTPGRYIEAIRAMEQAGVTTIIIDSLTHAWSGEGGSLDRQGKIADRSGNSWQAWRQVTPEHNALVEALLQSRCHIIATMRAKTEYVQEKDERTGKQVVRKIGLAPIMRDGIDYEFTIFMELDAQHMAYVGKDRTRLFDGQIVKPDAEIGRRLLDWLQTGEEEPVAAMPAMDEQQKSAFVESLDRARDLDELYHVFAGAYRAANAIPDAAAVAEFSRIKDERKAATGDSGRCDLWSACMKPVFEAFELAAQYRRLAEFLAEEHDDPQVIQRYAGQRIRSTGRASRKSGEDGT